MKLMKKLLCLTLVAVAAVTVAACDDEKQEENKVYTYNTYTLLTPSNWNELTYEDANDTEILNFISGSFFSYDYDFNEDGEINQSGFTVEYSAATKLEDVTSAYAGNTNYSVPSNATEGYAYKITLRNDLKWEDGEAITADDFIYTMKEQLNPLFKNYRADSYYVGSTVIHNAKNYVFQGDKGWYSSDFVYDSFAAADKSKLIFNVGNTEETKALLNPAADDSLSYASFRDGFGFPESYGAAQVAAYLSAQYRINGVEALQGKTIAEIKADATMSATLDAIVEFWEEGEDGILDFCNTYHEFVEIGFDKVGLFKGENDLELVIVLDKYLQLLKEDGSLSFKAAYNMASLPLVQESKYEQNKHEPGEGEDLWTTTYNQSVESTSSWGPYKLTAFQAGKQYILEKNPNWYGWNMKEYEGQYQTDRIVCEQVEDWNTAWLKFQKGEVDSISIDVSIAPDYKNSEQAIFTPDDYVGSLQIQSSVDAFKAYNKDGANPGKTKMLLAYPEFRKALSLAIDRNDFTQKCTTASKAGFGIFNSMHYYDVANGGAYRETDPARKVLCDTYGVDPEDYNSLIQAEAAITGYDLVQARQLVNEAVDKAVANNEYNGTDKVVIVFGSGAISEGTQRMFDYIKDAWTKLLVGTKLEGKLEMALEDHGKAWNSDFKAGAYDVCMGGWSGAAWDPGYFLLAYLDPNYMYSSSWDTASHKMEFTLTGAGENGEDVTLNLGLLEWYDILNGAHKTYNWAEGAVPNEKRLELIAALEGVILAQYYTVPLYYNFGASLTSYKWDYISRDYNTFMGYGGIRYITYNYSDAEWAAFVSSNGGQLNYKD